MKLRATILSLLICLNCYGQGETATPDPEQLIEDIFSFQDEDVDYSELYESLLLYYSHPLDINKATRNELRSLYILSDHQINSLIEYRTTYGKLLSIYELQAVPALDIDTIYKLLPFIQVRENRLASDNRPLLRRILDEPNKYLLLRYERTLETKSGYRKADLDKPASYSGTPDKIYARFRTSHARDFSIGFTAEKDAGEPLTDKDHGYGADFHSFHFQLQNKGALSNIIIGDYLIQNGQGLLLSAGFNVGKGGEAITTTRRTSSGIRPYTSVVEGGFFRGAAATFNIKPWLSITSFYSRLREDARISHDENGNELISAIQQTGYHRTHSEQDAKDQVTVQTYGANLRVNNHRKNLQIGLTVVGDLLELPLVPRRLPYNHFSFSGTENLNAGVSWNYTWQNLSLFGEAAASKSGGKGAIAGLIASLTPALETSIIFRNYDRDFHSFHGRSFAESTGRNQNEQGVYWGLKYKPSRKYQLAAWFDRFTFPWLKYRVDAPSDGYEYLIMATFRPQRSTLLTARFRSESKAVNPALKGLTIGTPVNGLKQNYQFSLRYPANKQLSFQSRAQFSTYNYLRNTTQGFLIAQDLNVEFYKFRISTRFALFDTDDFQNRQYAYERDVLYAFSLPPYSGRGSRQYILLQYGVTPSIDLWARYARTNYRDRETIGSGAEQIEGNIKTDIKLQLRVKF